ncbi:MAG TPA: hydrogenase maturation protease, partial [Gemmatimonadales bacterium]|nr:hydrogenase maturation protease [Gemmatimonadales bacterium]
RLILLDAVNAGLPPGTPVVLERPDLPRYFALKLSPHQIDLREVLALAELRGTLPLEVVAIGAQPGRLELDTELSPPLAQRVGEVAALAAARLERWGYRCRRIAGVVPA